MSATTTRERFDDYMAKISAQDIDAAFALIAEDAEFYDCSGETTTGKHDLREMAETLFAGIPDNTITRTINLAVSDGIVIGEFETSGTHTGTYKGHPPTGRRVTWLFTSVYEFDEAGLLKRQGYYYDTAGLAAKLSGDAPGDPAAVA